MKLAPLIAFSVLFEEEYGKISKYFSAPFINGKRHYREIRTRLPNNRIINQRAQILQYGRREK